MNNSQKQYYLELEINKYRWLIEKDFSICISFVVDGRPTHVMQHCTNINLKKEMTFLLSEIIIEKEQRLEELKLKQ